MLSGLREETSTTRRRSSLRADGKDSYSNVGASALARAGATTNHVGTAVLSCPVERSSTDFYRGRTGRSFARPDSRGGYTHMVRGDGAGAKALAPTLRQLVRRLGDSNQRGQDSAEDAVLGIAEGKIKFAVKQIELVVNPLLGFVRLEDPVRRANFSLRLLDGLKCSSREECEDCRTQAGYAFAWHQYRPPQHIGVDAVQYIVFLRNTAGVDNALDRDPMVSHAVEDDAGMERGAFNGGE